MKFVKMHGIANDYVYIDAFNNPAVVDRFSGHDGAALIQRMSDRHTGIGSDGVILVCRPAHGVDAHVRMRMFNADGSESEMCGNGVRCVAKFAHDRLGVRAHPMKVQTGRGVLPIRYETSGSRLHVATVDMDEPILMPSRIPTTLASGQERAVDVSPGPDLARALAILGVTDREQVVTCVSMGNPHCVFFGAPTTEQQVREVGPVFEKSTVFPRGVNFHAVSIDSRLQATMRTWERGAGITLACGTGACAVLVAGVLAGKLDRDALIHLPGGDLRIRWDESSNHVFMTGPATDVFEGDWPDGAGPQT